MSDIEREHVAPAREEPSGEASRSDGEVLGRVAAGRPGVRSEPRVSWAPTDIAALQRTAGNAVVARMLTSGKGSRVPVKGAARSVIQRDLTTKAKDIDATKGRKSLREHLKGLKGYLELYPKASESDKLLYLPLMFANVRDWLTGFRADRASQSGRRSVENLDLERQLEALRGELYIESLELRGFEYASSESHAEVRATRELMSGKTSTSAGMGPDALKAIQGAGLTEAETLAIKVYSVGDYRAINKTLQQASDQDLTRALQEMGLVKAVDLQGRSYPVLPPHILAAKGLFQKGDPEWKKRKALFKQWAPSFKPDLQKAREEARLHAEMLMAAFTRMHAFAYKGRTWRGMRLDPTWPVYRVYTTRGAVDDVNSFYSTSQLPAEATKFAVTQSPDNREGFLVECFLKNGRDISMFSQHPKEKEVLVLPRAKLTVKVVRPTTDPAVARRLQTLLNGQPPPPTLNWYVLVEEQ